MHLLLVFNVYFVRYEGGRSARDTAKGLWWQLTFFLLYIATWLTA